MSNFFADRDLRGKPLEYLIADTLHYRGIPFGFNPYSESEDKRREEYDLYIGQPHEAILLEAKMDWMSAKTGNICIERPTLEHSKAHLFAYGLPYVHVFTREEAVKLFNSHPKKLVGDQKIQAAIVPRKATKGYGKPFWVMVKELSQRQ